MCVCACARVCVRACVRACVRSRNTAFQQKNVVDNVWSHDHAHLVIFAREAAGEYERGFNLSDD